VIHVDGYVGRFRKQISSSAFWFNGSTKQEVEKRFRMASRLGADSANLDLRLRTDRIDHGAAPVGKPTTVPNLQASLHRLFKPQKPTTTQPRKLGLIYANLFYGHPDLFGLMFDEYVVPGNVAREGCAVFLKAIRKHRSSKEDYRREVIFTTIHELGHVFNLWHDQGSPNFMASSPAAAPYPKGAHYFKGLHRKYLRQSQPKRRSYLQPGGRAFGVRPPGFPPNASAANNPLARRSLRTGLRLRVGIEPRSFWYFDPVELDLSVSCTQKDAIRLPHQLDPGYDRFVVWIDLPDGTRSRYRPTKWFAHNPAELEIAKGKPFHRDLSVFVQAGGYTFGPPGEYAVRVTYELADGTVVASNRVAFELREQPHRHTSYERLERAMTRPRVVEYLYQREGRLWRRDREAIQYVRRYHRGSPAAAGLEYAIGRDYARRARTHQRRRKEAVAKASDHLMRAIDHERLSTHRRRIAQRTLEEVEVGD